jgi:4-hydroxy-tetrahydrodipicolinate reductase
MDIALIGYGKMGKEIERIAVSRGHRVSLIIDVDNTSDLTAENLKKCDVAIEFTRPETAVSNYYKCFEAGIPVVSGTTGWLDRKEEVLEKCLSLDATFFYASNFSIGMNLFFELNRKLATLMSGYNNYRASMTEIHHTQKLDAPSGTAISLANDMIDILPGLKNWVNKASDDTTDLPIISERTGTVPGTHIIKYESDVDYIEITHCVKSRSGLAYGSVLAAEYCLNHSGILTMNDLLRI